VPALGSRPEPASPVAALAPAVALRGVSVTRGRRPVLRDIDVEIAPGTVTGLLGPSGCGKTTLLRLVAGLQRPTAGEVEVFGRQPGVAELRTRVAYVAQGASVYLDLTVEENLRYFGALIGAGAGDRIRALEATELTELADRGVSQLSGGQVARVSLATALLGRPDLLVLDEPTAGIDPVLREQLWKTLRGLADEGVTLLVSSHVMEESDWCDQLVLMRDGRVLTSGAPDALRRSTGATTMTEAFVALVARGHATPAPVCRPARRSPVTVLREAAAWRPERPTRRWSLATATRVLRQLRRDRVSVALVAVIPIVLLGLMRLVFSGGGTFDRIAVPLIGIFPFMALFMLASVAFLRERTTATLERLMTLPAARADIVAGYAVAFAVVGLLQAGLATAFGFLVLDVDSAGSPALVVAVAFLAALAGAGLGVLSSVVARTEFQAVLWMSLLVLPQVVLCGLLVPRDDMLDVLRIVSAAMPLTYAYELLDALGRGTELGPARAALDVAVLVAGAWVPLVAATYALRRS
jgi:ABC transporter DrrB family efflux protein